MHVVKALELPIEQDLSELVAVLRHYHIPHRVIEQQGQQVLWVSADRLEAFGELYQAWSTDALPNDWQSVEMASSSTAATHSLISQLKRAPITVSVLLVSLIVAVITQLGANFVTLSYFSFTDYHLQGSYLYFDYVADSLSKGQWWRLITPIFIHFGLLHLAMNSLWFWELGKRIELKQNAVFLLLLTLVSGVISNYSQYAFSGPSLFGGLSGVLYALLGFCWIYQRFIPSAFADLPKGVVIMMLVWLVLCLTGIVTWLGFGAIANAAHVSGLIVGCLAGAVGGWRAKQQQVR